MNLLMLGGTRFLGCHLVEGACRAGFRVTVFHRGTTGTVHATGPEGPLRFLAWFDAEERPRRNVRTGLPDGCEQALLARIGAGNPKTR